MKINWEVRFKNPVFVAQVIMAIVLPVLAYMQLTPQDLTSWNIVWELLKAAILNPYVLALVVVNVWQTVNDPTTAGLSDSNRALQYAEPFDALKKDLNSEGNENDDAEA